MLLMIKNHLNGTWFYELLKCYFRVHSKVTPSIMITVFNLYMNALSNGLCTSPDIQAFLLVWNFYNKNHRCEEWRT